MYWFWFTATKNNKQVRERIPCDTWENAKKELENMGYSNIKMFDSYPVRDYSTTYVSY